MCLQEHICNSSEFWGKLFSEVCFSAPSLPMHSLSFFLQFFSRSYTAEFFLPPLSWLSGLGIALSEGSVCSLLWSSFRFPFGVWLGAAFLSVTLHVCLCLASHPRTSLGAALVLAPLPSTREVPWGLGHGTQRLAYCRQTSPGVRWSVHLIVWCYYEPSTFPVSSWV